MRQENQERIYRTFRDSVIQRFEYTFDTTWKYVSKFLQKEGRILQIKTPKAIFRECLKAKILSDDQVRLSIKMVDSRNLTTHGYDEELIEAIFSQIPLFINLLEYLLIQSAPTEKPLSES